MTGALFKFWQANSDAIIISLITGFVFFVLGPIGVWFSGRKIRRERTRKATEALIDLIEEMLVSGETVEASKITTLFRAIERENGVQLDGNYDTDNLLDDITLRFAKSKHLDAAQKNKYTEQIDTLRTKMQEAGQTKMDRKIPVTYAKMLEQLRADVQSGNAEKATETVTALEKRLGERAEFDPFLNIFRVYGRIYNRSPKVFWIAFVIVLAFYAAIVRAIISG